MEKTFSRVTKSIIPILYPLGNMAQRIKKVKNPEMFFTVRQLLKTAQIDADTLSSDVQKILDEKVLQVCRAGSRFTKKCICVQLYDDGPTVLTWAMEHGALLCITKQPLENYPCIVVENPEKVYADMCSAIHSADPINATAITGSIGKTTTKKMVYSVYRTEYSTFCDAGNDNQIDGVGYISQHIPKKTEKWLQEVSEDTPGCVLEISKIVRPKISIITAIDKSHIEQFGGEEGILDEVRSITQYMPNDAICITSMDEQNTATLVKSHKVIFVSMNNKEADFYADSISVDTEGIKFDVIDKATKNVSTIRLRNVYAVHNVYCALYAFAAGCISGISYKNIVKGLENYKSTGIRQNVFKSKGITVYADCYNAVAKSVRSAINACSEIPVKGKRIAVLGDIAETGDYTQVTHLELIDIVNSSDFDVLIALGKNICKAIQKVELRKGLTVIACESHKQLNRVLNKTMKRGDLVLFKASHSVRLDKCLRSVFRFAYVYKMIEYAWPQVIWRFKVIFS